MKIIEEGNSKWNEREMVAECQYCGCKFSGTVKDEDFKVLTDNPKLYIYEAICPTCGNKLKF